MNSNRNVVLFVGGVGGAKLAYGLMQELPAKRLTIIVNTGDDFWHYGLRVCPDLDTITYTLSGLVDRVNGWGIEEDTSTSFDALGHYGEVPWFRLGDKDLATHMLRTKLWHEGQTLTQIVQHMTATLGIKCSVLPMANTPVATIIDTVEHGELGFQEYFVKHSWQPTVCALRYDGIDNAKISDEISQSIKAADLIVIGPSNPWLSIDPILNVPGLRQLIMEQDVPRVAVTPIIEGKAVKGPAAKIMQELGYSVSAEAVVNYYGEVINGFIYDNRDGNLETKHLRITAFDTLMTDDEKRIALAHNLLKWTRDWK